MPEVRPHQSWAEAGQGWCSGEALQYFQMKKNACRQASSTLKTSAGIWGLGVGMTSAIRKLLPEVSFRNVKTRRKVSCPSVPAWIAKLSVGASVSSCRRSAGASSTKNSWKSCSNGKFQAAEVRPCCYVICCATEARSRTVAHLTVVKGVTQLGELLWGNSLPVLFLI